MRIKNFLSLSLICVSQIYGVNADTLDLSKQIELTRTACSGISDSMADLKKMAGINTAITAVGTVAGGVALGSGIAKSNVDKEQQELMEKVARLIAEQSDVPIEQIDIEDEKIFKQQILDTVNRYQNYVDQIEELEQKSKKLGNIRTGTLAASTVTNVAGTAIAAANKIDNSLESKIKKCMSAVKVLSDVKLGAKVENSATGEELSRADSVIAKCRDWESVDLTLINKRATGAAVSAGTGAVTGVVGTITSAVANTDATRKGNNQKEKNLNATANVMAGASTAASAVATVFNAAQISAIKKAVVVADACEEALK